MDRRRFLKILGVASASVAIPSSIKYLISHIERNTYKEDLLVKYFGDLLKHISPEEFKFLDSLNEQYAVYQVGDGMVRVTNNIKYRLNKLDAWDKEIEVLAVTNNIFEASIKQAQLNEDLNLPTQYDIPYFWNRVRGKRSSNPVSRAKAGAKISKKMKGNAYNVGRKNAAGNRWGVTYIERTTGFTGTYDDMLSRFNTKDVNHYAKLGRPISKGKLKGLNFQIYSPAS